MTVPKAIFIDTSIFVRSKFDFTSPTFSAFVEAAAGNECSLLLPSPTEQEIGRHLHEHVDSVYPRLKSLQREFPNVKKWKRWSPIDSFAEFAYPKEIEEVFLKEWRTFTSRLNVVRLNYDGVSLNKIMGWYASARPPFNTGKKRKEFPDAFAIEILLNYCMRNEASVAVVSGDNDFRLAASEHSPLLYFPSVAAFTEVAVVGPEQNSRLKKVIEDGNEVIEREITSTFSGLIFILDAGYSGDAEFDSVIGIEMRETKIIGISKDAVSVYFACHIDYSANVKLYEFRDSDRYDEYTDLPEGTVDDWAELDGVMKLLLSDDGDRLEGVETIQVSNDMVYVTEYPE